MIIAGKYSFNEGEKAIEKTYPMLLNEIVAIINSVDSTKHVTKVSKEKTMPGKMLNNPASLNKDFKQNFNKFGWNNYKITCNYPTNFYVGNYKPSKQKSGQKPYRDMDFVKQKLGVEVQFGKYAFMVYNVCAKMTIFHKLGIIDLGVEIVPVKEFANKMSTGVSYFEQFVWDLDKRGISDIDIPVLILGIAEK